MHGVRADYQEVRTAGGQCIAYDVLILATGSRPFLPPIPGLDQPDIHLYRTSYAYHGVHPFYMWYWGAHALQWLGRVIVVGGDPRAVRRLGFQPASTMQDAFEMAGDVVGPRPTITHLHNPPIVMADVT